MYQAMQGAVKYAYFIFYASRKALVHGVAGRLASTKAKLPFVDGPLVTEELQGIRAGVKDPGKAHSTLGVRADVPPVHRTAHALASAK